MSLTARRHGNTLPSAPAQVLHAQAAGAAAVVVSDHEETGQRLMSMSGLPEKTQDIHIPSVFVSREAGERLWGKRLWPPSGRMFASVNATGHLRPQRISALETLWVYVLVSMLLIVFSSMSAVLVALGLAW